jgi:hypothetical protein
MPKRRIGPTLLLSPFLPTDPHPTAYPGFLLHLTCLCLSLFDTSPTRLASRLPLHLLALSFHPLALATFLCLVSRVGFRFRASLPILGTSWRSALVQNQVDPFFSLVFFRVSAVSYAGPKTGRETIPTPAVKSQPQSCPQPQSNPILISTATIPRPYYTDREGCTGTYSHTHSQTHASTHRLSAQPLDDVAYVVEVQPSVPLTTACLEIVKVR